MGFEGVALMLLSDGQHGKSNLGRIGGQGPQVVGSRMKFWAWQRGVVRARRLTCAWRRFCLAR